MRREWLVGHSAAVRRVLLGRQGESFFLFGMGKGGMDD